MDQSVALGMPLPLQTHGQKEQCQAGQLLILPGASPRAVLPHPRPPTALKLFDENLAASQRKRALVTLFSSLLGRCVKQENNQLPDHVTKRVSEVYSEKPLWKGS